MGDVSARPKLGSTTYGSARVSPQRLAIAEAVEASAHRTFSADDIAREVRRRSPKIGLATVYRAMAAMQSAGSIEGVGERDGAIVYARCGQKAHHHHVVCTSCGAVEDVDCPIDVDAAASLGGFLVTGHSLVLRGLCAGCQQEQMRTCGLQDA